MRGEIEIKTERLRALLAAERLGGVLLSAQHNFAWATGGRSNRVNASVEPGACALFYRADGRRFVLASRIEMPRMLAEEISAADFEPVEFAWQDEKAAGDFVIERAKTLSDNGLPIATDLLLDPRARSIENLVARCRYELTGPELERYRSLGRDAGAVLGEIFRMIAPGATEIEIARKTKDALAAGGIESIVTLVAADERIEKFRHPVPTENIWRKTLLIAVCARRAGLVASLSRIVCAGAVPDALRIKTDAVARVFAAFLAATRAGATGAEIYAKAAAAYRENGFGDELDRHHQGGAAGYKSRDWTAHPKCGEIVRPRQAFAWNPSITGTKAEETVILNGGEIEVLTATPDFPRIPVEIDGRSFFAPAVLSL